METEYIDSEGLPYPFGSKRDILTFLFKQKKIIITVFVLSLFALGYWVYTTIPLYEASARFLLKFGRENIYRAEVGNKSHILADTDQFIASEIDIISSTDLVSRVVELKPYKAMRFRSLSIYRLPKPVLVFSTRCSRAPHYLPVVYSRESESHANHP